MKYKSKPEFKFIPQISFADKFAAAERLVNENKIEEALVIFSQLLNEDPDNINVLNDLAIVAIISKNIPEALEYLKRVLTNDPINKIALDNFKYIQTTQEYNDLVNFSASPNQNVQTEFKSKEFHETEIAEDEKISTTTKPILTIGLMLATRYSHGYNSFVPLGIGYLEKSITKEFSNVKVILAEKLEELLIAKPDIIGISSTTENYHVAINSALEIKEKLRVPVILGGIHISLLPKSLQDCFDLAVIGEGEITLVEVLKSYIKNDGLNYDELKEIPGLLFKHNGDLIQTPGRQVIQNLDELPKPNVEELPFYDPAIAGCIVSARGCPYKCSFCASEKFAHHYRSLSTDLIVDEIEFMVKKKNTRHIVFYDDLLIANKKKVIELVTKLEKKKILGQCTFSCQVRANLITDEICELLNKLNVTDVGIGTESFSDKILEYYNKKGVTGAINQQAFDLLHKYGIRVNPSIILGAPIETKEDLLITLRAVFENVRDNKITGPAWGTLRPYPGTRIWDYAEEAGIVSSDMDWARFSDWSNFETYLCKEIPKPEFYELIDEWVAKISLLAKDRPAVEGNFVIKDPIHLIKKIKYFQNKLKDRVVPDLGDELILEYENNPGDLLLDSGWYDISDNGSRWINKTAKMFFQNGHGLKYIIVGHIPPEIFNNIYNRELEVRVLLNDEECLVTKKINEQNYGNGNFNLEFVVPEDSEIFLTIESDKSFVPSKYDVNGDTRELSLIVNDILKLNNNLNAYPKEDKTENSLNEFNDGRISDSSNDSSAKLLEAENFIEKQEYQLAKELLNALLISDNNNIDILNDLSVVAILEEDFIEANRLIQSILKLDPQNEIAGENYRYLVENAVDFKKISETTSLTTEGKGDINWELGFQHYCKGNGIEIGCGGRPLPGLDSKQVDLVNNYNGFEYHVDFLTPADELKFSGDSEYDYIIHSNMLEHLANPVKALIEWHRVLKPGGTLYMIVPDKRLWIHDRQRNVSYPQEWKYSYLENRSNIPGPPNNPDTHFFAYTPEVLKNCLSITEEIRDLFTVENFYTTSNKVVAKIQAEVNAFIPNGEHMQKNYEKMQDIQRENGEHAVGHSFHVVLRANK